MPEGKSFEEPPREEIEPPHEETKEEFRKAVEILSQGGESSPDTKILFHTHPLKDGRELTAEYYSEQVKGPKAVARIIEDIAGSKTRFKMDEYVLYTNGAVERLLNIADLDKSAPKGKDTATPEKLIKILEPDVNRVRMAREMGVTRITEAELRAINALMKTLIEKRDDTNS